MKIESSSSIALLFTPLLVMGTILNNVATAQAATVEIANIAELKFSCDDSFNEKLNKKVPTTIAWRPNGKIVLIQWVKDLDNYWTPQKRCDEFSKNINTAHRDGTLKFITSSRDDKGNKVICSALKKGGKCENELMTLRPKDNPLLFLNDIKRVLDGRSFSHIEHSSQKPQIYIQIEWDRFIDKATKS
jgi:Circadian oscillating protein COP23